MQFHAVKAGQNQTNTMHNVQSAAVLIKLTAITSKRAARRLFRKLVLTWNCQHCNSVQFYSDKCSGLIGAFYLPPQKRCLYLSSFNYPPLRFLSVCYKCHQHFLAIISRLNSQKTLFVAYGFRNALPWVSILNKQNKPLRTRHVRMPTNSYFSR